MESLVRVMRGAWPYRWRVIIGLLCALGVGMSYASGVATMLPVMKIFISAEGIHGWVDHWAAQQRLHIRFLSLDASARKDQIALIVTRTDKGVTKSLAGLVPGDRIVAVQLAGGAGAKAQHSSAWKGMAAILAAGPAGQKVILNIQSASQLTPRSVTVVLARQAWWIRQVVRSINLLPVDPFTSLCWVVIFFIVLCIVGGAFRYFQQYLAMTVAARMVIDLRRRAYNRVLQLPASYFSQKGTSDVMSRLTQDTNNLTDGVASLMGKLVLEPVKALFVAVVALWVNWELCVAMVLVVPVIGLIIRQFSKRMRRASQRGLERWSGMLSIMQESLSGQRVVKAYTAEGYERRRFAQANRALYQQQRKLSHYAALSRPTIEAMAVVLASVPILILAKLVLQDSISKESFFLLLACFAAIFEPLRKLSDVNTKLQQANAAATRIFEIIDLEPEYDHSRQLPALPRHHESIEFRAVGFEYPGHDKTVLDHISFRVLHGQTTAVVGGNGSGKTTLLSLLPRLYVATRGQVLIDGVDTAGVTLRSLRRQIGVVSQDTVLFADTIYNNIAYGRRHATAEQIMDAARRSYVDDFVASMPDGYQTMIGQDGVRLSGGQRQRLAIARAILRDPAILILDEAMSQIDNESELKITLSLRDFMRNRTTFVIAHRLGTITSADTIICLDAGRMVGIGTHQQLMAVCPEYRQLYETQFRQVG